MLDLERLEKVRLMRLPPGQIFLAEAALRWDYLIPRRTVIELEGVENLPRDRAVFLAMNHTDRYNYWPFQYELHRRRLGYTATWVKGKYYENPWMARFLEAMNNIPVPSRGYVITTLYRLATGRRPSEEDYRYLRDLVDGSPEGDTPPPSGVLPLFQRHGDGTAASFEAFFEGYFHAMIDEVVRLNDTALRKLHHHILVFPQGTRSIRLSRGHTGLVQMAQHLGATIVPVGCNGSDHVYPGNSPFAKGGHIVYRIGPPLEVDGPELSPHRIEEPFRPLTRETATRFAEPLRRATDVVMRRINDLLDPPYRFADDQSSDGVGGVARFV